MLTLVSLLNQSNFSKTTDYKDIENNQGCNFQRNNSIYLFFIVKSFINRQNNRTMIKFQYSSSYKKGVTRFHLSCLSATSKKIKPQFIDYSSENYNSDAEDYDTYII